MSGNLLSQLEFSATLENIKTEPATSTTPNSDPDLLMENTEEQNNISGTFFIVTTIVFLR